MSVHVGPLTNSFAHLTVGPAIGPPRRDRSGIPVAGCSLGPNVTDLGNGLFSDERGRFRADAQRVGEYHDDDDPSRVFELRENEEARQTRSGRARPVKRVYLERVSLQLHPFTAAR